MRVSNKVPQFDPAVSLQRFDDVIKSQLDDRLYLLVLNASLVCVDDVGLGHAVSSCEADIIQSVIRCVREETPAAAAAEAPKRHLPAL